MKCYANGYLLVCLQEKALLVFLPYEMLRQWVPVGVFLKIALLQFLALKCYANGYLLVCIQEKALLVFLAFEMLRQRAPVGVFTRKSAASVPSL